MSTIKALTLAALLGVSMILATAIQAGTSIDSPNPEPALAERSPAPGSPEAFLRDPYYP
jgi:hypothetical protein